MLSKGGIVYYICYLGHKLERDELAGNEGEVVVIEGNRPFLWAGQTRSKHCRLCHQSLLSQPYFTFPAPAPAVELVSALARPHPPSLRLCPTGPSKAQEQICSATFLILPRAQLPRSSQQSGDEMSPSPAPGPQAVGARSVSKFTG